MSRTKIGETLRSCWEKYRYVALIAAIGAALLLWPEGEKTLPAPVSAAESGTDLAAVREEMEEILSHISGVGELRLMLTVESDGERQLAQDTELTYSGSAAAPEDYSRRSETVLTDGGGDGTVVTRTLYPTYRGALVVCQGGDRADVRLTVTEAVASLTGLSADRITVAKWQ